MSDLSLIQRQFLHLLVKREALRFGEFTLKSGRTSPYFVNTGSFNQGGDLARLGSAYATIIHQHLGPDVDVIFGPAYKGIPLALAAAQAYEVLVDRPIGWAYDRKEAKDHGDGGNFVGAPLEPGTKVVLVDDVLTAGTALRDSIAKLQPLGVDLLAAVISVDRQERGQRGAASAREEIEQDFSLPIHPIITISQAVDYLSGKPIKGTIHLDETQAETIRAHLATAQAN